MGPRWGESPPLQDKETEGHSGSISGPANPFLSRGFLPRRDETAEGRQSIAQDGQKRKEGSGLDH